MYAQVQVNELTAELKEMRAEVAKVTQQGCSDQEYASKLTYYESELSAARTALEEERATGKAAAETLKTLINRDSTAETEDHANLEILNSRLAAPTHKTRGKPSASRERDDTRVFASVTPQQGSPRQVPPAVGDVCESPGTGSGVLHHLTNKVISTVYASLSAPVSPLLVFFPFQPPPPPASGNLCAA